MITHTPGTQADPPCACPECDRPIPYKVTSEAALWRMRARGRRLVYASAFMVAFALGTLAGLVLQCGP